jgi:hypothetical protein
MVKHELAYLAAGAVRRFMVRASPCSKSLDWRRSFRQSRQCEDAICGWNYRACARADRNADLHPMVMDSIAT